MGHAGKRKKPVPAGKVLDRMIGNDRKLRARIDEQKLNVRVAEMIYAAREDAGHFGSIDDCSALVVDRLARGACRRIQLGQRGIVERMPDQRIGCFLHQQYGGRNRAE